MSSLAGLLTRKRLIEADTERFNDTIACGEYIRILQKLNRVCCGILDFRWPCVEFPLYFRCGSSDLPNFRQMFIAKEYNFPLNFCPARILDLGAYAGYASVFLARRFPNAEIVCVEPVAANFQMLTLNTTAYSHVRRLNAGVWGHSTRLDVANTSGGDWGIRLSEINDINSGLQAFSVPDIMDWAGWDKFDYLKCDVEGAELSVFRETGVQIASMLLCCTVETHDAIAPGATEAVRRTFPPTQFINSRSGEFELFIRRHPIDRLEESVPAISVLRPQGGRREIFLSRVSDEFWGYYTFDVDSFQLHPAESNRHPSELVTFMDMDGQSMFTSRLSVHNVRGHAVDFIVSVQNAEGATIATAQTTVPAGTLQEWQVPLDGPAYGSHRLTLQTIMTSGAPTSHQAFANWISPHFHS